MNQNQTFFSKYQLVSSSNLPTILGFGSHSSVQLAINIQTNKYFAIKKIQKKLALKQSLIHSTLNHQNIVKFIEPFHDFQTQSSFLVLQYLSKGSLHELITQSSILSISQICKIFKSVCTGLIEIHKNSIIHRDIKPSNIMLDHMYDPKICDFGTATVMKIGLTEVCGTFQYLAPQVLLKKPYDHRIDIWALGVSLYELIEGKIPFQQKRAPELLKQMKKPLKYTKHRTQNFMEIIQKMLNFNPDHRPTLNQIIKFLNKVETQFLPSNLQKSPKSIEEKYKHSQKSQNQTFDQINDEDMLIIKVTRPINTSQIQQKLQTQKPCYINKSNPINNSSTQSTPSIEQKLQNELKPKASTKISIKHFLQSRKS